MAELHIDYNVSGQNWQDDIIGNKIDDLSVKELSQFRSIGRWIDNTHFATNTYQGNTSSNNIRIYKFNLDGTVKVGLSITYSGFLRQYPPTSTEIDNSVDNNGSATWVGKLPNGTVSDKGALTPHQKKNLKSLQSHVDYQLQELYKAPGTSSESLELNYNATMMAGILVAMLGTTVLFYTFKNI